MKLRKILTTIFIVFFIANVFALKLVSPDEIQENFPWNFSIELDSTDAFDEAKVYLDDQHIVSAYSNGIVQINPLNGLFVEKSFIFDYDPASNSGLTLYVSHLGLKKGTHKIKIRTFKAGEELTEKSKNVLVFKALNSAFESNTQKKIDELNAKIQELETENSKLKTKLNKLVIDETSLLGVQEQVNNLNVALNEVKKTQKYLKDTQTNMLKKETTTTVNKSKGFNPISGFNSLFGQDSKKVNETDILGRTILPLLGLLVIIVVLVILIFSDKIGPALQNVQLFSKPANEKLFEEPEIEMPFEPANKRKWAYNNDADLIPMKKIKEQLREEDKEEKVSIRDLVKKSD